MTSPKSAPNYVVHRNAVAAIDTVAAVVRRVGINMAGFQKANIQVIPSTVSAAPAVAVYWWCGFSEAWIQEHTAIAKASAGAGVGYEFTVECNHRIMLVAITAIVADAATVLVAGVPFGNG